MYKHCVDQEQSKIPMPVQAAVCNEPESCGHHRDIQEYLDAICGVLLRSGKLCIYGKAQIEEQVNWVGMKISRNQSGRLEETF